ncbi:UNVERIFIED_CONTAM: hypothetical protein K2H54_028581 [Gekko kuhli]
MVQWINPPPQLLLTLGAFTHLLLIFSLYIIVFRSGPLQLSHWLCNALSQPLAHQPLALTLNTPIWFSGSTPPPAVINFGCLHTSSPYLLLIYNCVSEWPFAALPLAVQCTFSAIGPSAIGPNPKYPNMVQWINPTPSCY